MHVAGRLHDSAHRLSWHELQLVRVRVRVRGRGRVRIRVGVRIRVRARAGARARARARVRSVSPTSGLPTARILYKIIEVLEARATARRCSMSDMSH